MPSSSRGKTQRASQVGLPARKAATEILRRVLTEKRPLDVILSQSAESGLMTGLTQKDRALARAIVSTALRRKGQIDNLVAGFSKTPLNRKRSGIAYEALLCGAAQILFLRVPAHAAIDLAVRVVSYDRRGGRKLTGYVNALLHRIAEAGAAVLEAQNAERLNTPGWLYESWTKAYGGPGAKAVAAAHLEEPALDLTIAAEPAEWADRLGGIHAGGNTVRLSSSGRIEHLDGYEDGKWWVQDFAAALPALLLGDVRGRKILDLCAAPGGKTAQLAAAGAEVTAVDVSEARLVRVRENLARLKLDATIRQADVLELDGDGDLADGILLDAPCSATGTIRRHPDIPHLKTKGDIRKLTDLQGKLLKKAAGLLKPGGTLVYCVCSLQTDEGERQVQKFLKSEPRFKRDPIVPGDLPHADFALTAEGDLRTLPSMAAAGSPGMDGFYAARLRCEA
ncbi:MAG: RsmB/NOP family class I SAM-dependent RNA methyltransferase [Pseudomonadota bacterium]